MYALRAYINKSVFGKTLLEIEKVLKILSRIEKAVKTFSIPDKIFSKNGILLYVLKAHVNKILYIYICKKKLKKKKVHMRLRQSV